MTSWILSGILLLLLVIVFVFYQRVKAQLRQEQTETARLHNRLQVMQDELDEVNSRRKKLLSPSTQALMIVESNYTISNAG